MKKMKLLSVVHGAMAALALSGSIASAADTVPVLFGKDNWLFTPYEFATVADAPDTSASIQMFQKINKLFEDKGITLALVIVPSKIRIHSDKLPDNKPLDSYTAEKYGKAVTALRERGVHVINLNDAFLASPHRTSDTPLFLQLDTHWSPAGALLAAETIKKEIDADPVLKATYAKTAEEKYTLVMNPKKSNTRARDLVRLLPAGSPSFPPERILAFKVSRAQESQSALLGSGERVEITVIGSSYSNKNTLYPDGLRYTLQRNLLDLSIPVDQGPWVGMEAYLKDESFKTNKPKLIIWEIPERELRSPPNNGARDPRYIINNDQWVSRVTALLQ